MPLRPDLAARLAQYRSQHTPPIQIYEKLCVEFDFDFSRSELELIRLSFGWKPGWRFFQERDLPQMRANHIRAQAMERQWKADRAARYNTKRTTDFLDQQFKSNARTEPKAKATEPTQPAYHNWFHPPPAPTGCPSYLVTLVTRLELTWPFTMEELRRQFRVQAKKTHPDTGGTAAAFQEVLVAYETLQTHTKG